MPTAFRATFGKGKPVLATYAEYDAVPGNSQDPIPFEKPRDSVHQYAAGHTDPHSALGLGALGGLLAAKAAMEKHGLPGNHRPLAPRRPPDRTPGGRRRPEAQAQRSRGRLPPCSPLHSPRRLQARPQLWLRPGRAHPPQLLRGRLPPGCLPARPTPCRPHHRTCHPTRDRVHHTWPRLPRPGVAPQAEQQFQFAIAADSNSAAAHAGLAEVRHAAVTPRTHAQRRSIRSIFSPTCPRCSVLARLDMAQNQLAAAAEDVSRALHVEPSNSTALAMRQSLQQRGQSVR